MAFSINKCVFSQIGKKTLSIVIVMCIAIISIYFFTRFTFPNSDSEFKTAEILPYGVIGILSADKNVQLRNKHRHFYSDVKENNVILRFLLDKPTRDTIEEAYQYSDIIFLNSSYSGRAVRFGEKLAKWINITTKIFPDAKFVGKMDDDVFICDYSFRMVWKRWSPLMYLGWSHDSKIDRLTKRSRIDEMFVILGEQLAHRISKRQYCHDLNVCNTSRDLYDTNYGGTSLGLWLSIYPDVNFVKINKWVIHTKKKIKPKAELCRKKFLLHRVKSPEMMDILYAKQKSTRQRAFPE